MALQQWGYCSSVFFYNERATTKAIALAAAPSSWMDSHLRWAGIPCLEASFTRDYERLRDEQEIAVVVKAASYPFEQMQRIRPNGTDNLFLLLVLWSKGPWCRQVTTRVRAVCTKCVHNKTLVITIWEELCMKTCAPVLCAQCLGFSSALAEATFFCGFSGTAPRLAAGGPLLS